MRLELRWSVVDEVVAGSATRLAGKRLEVDLDGLRSLLSADARLTGIRLDLVHPGERCRIARVFDVIAPRAKLDSGEDFPGVLGGVARAGQGQTLALASVAVVATDQQTAGAGHRALGLSRRRSARCAEDGGVPGADRARGRARPRRGVRAAALAARPP